MSEWISVDDRLPSYGDPVIVVSKFGIVQYYTFKISVDDEENCAWSDIDECDYYDICEFSHWMPLPEPPKTKAP